MTLLVFIYVYRIDMNIERLMPCSNKHNLHLKNILSSNNKSKQQSMTSCRCKYNALYNLIFSYFKLLFVDAINWKIVYLFLLASLEYRLGEEEKDRRVVIACLLSKASG